ncbi:MAG: tetratricopeptide repeat protein [Spirochaetaceae bacterium]|jgi:tetratricopeptide (TPR) repeat protein|nr:tetratricopeptide repeat protein [Spirochaetaceae bacterium]
MIKPQNRFKISMEVLKKQVFQGIVILAALAGAFFLVQPRIREAGAKKNLLEFWTAGSYGEAYEKSREGLAKNPLDPFFLTMNGFSSYQLALTQISGAGSLVYVDECIWSLRKVLLEKNADKDGRIRYVLGKAYYLKGPEYADLAVRYLEEAKAARYDAGDLGEYLGLAYSALKDYRKSIEALTGSLNPRDEGADSDLLLLYIAQSYMGLEDWDAARAYLKRCAEQSRDTDIVVKSTILLGKVLFNSGDSDGALAALESVLETGGENAEASFEIGEIYASRGDTIRARAAWRRAYRADPNYAPVLSRLNTI